MEIWLARDKSGLLQLYIGSKPRKYKFMWVSLKAISIYKLDKALFPEVQWSDDEPTKVKLIIDK